MDRTLFNNSNLQNIEQPIGRKSQLNNVNLKSGYSLLFDHKIPIEIKYIDYDRNVKHLGSNEIVNFKIYTFGYKPNISSVKVEIDSDGDPFFASVFETNENIFSILREQQKLNFDLQQFPTILIKSLNKIEQSNTKVNASLLIYSDGKCRLTISHTSSYKNIQIMALDFNQDSQQSIDSRMTEKYQQLRNKLTKTEQRLRKINQIVREKHPSLLMQIHKTKSQ